MPNDKFALLADLAGHVSDGRSAAADLAEHVRDQALGHEHILLSIAEHVKELAGQNRALLSTVGALEQSVLSRADASTLQNIATLTRQYMASTQQEMDALRRWADRLEKESGQAVEFDLRDGFIVWRQGGDWQKLIAMERLRGARGPAGGGGSGNMDSSLWRPSVSEAGDLSWAKSPETVPPAIVNIKGANGAPGADGADGADGTDGAPGATGPAGAQGQKGDKGDPGTPGPQGPQGPKGDAGPAGAAGAAGAQGAQGDPGIAGVGVPAGGTAGQFLSKIDSADYNTQWATVDNKADLIDGKVPASQLPSYVDDVLSYANLAGFPATGEVGKIYIAENTNVIYRWNGSGYSEISASLALGETAATAYRGDRGKTAYDHSQAVGNPHGTTLAALGGFPSGGGSISGMTQFNNVSGDTGGSFTLGKPATNSTLAGNLGFDVYRNLLRIFETGSPYRGVSVDLTQCGSQSGLYHSGNHQSLRLGVAGTATPTATGLDANTITVTCQVYVLAGVNLPTGTGNDGYGWVSTFYYAAESGHATQIYTNVAGWIGIRAKNNGVWSAWQALNSLVSDGLYWGLSVPSGGYIRSPVNGIIPDIQTSSAANVGTSSWPFNNVYARTAMYVGGQAVWHANTLRVRKGTQAVASGAWTAVTFGYTFPGIPSVALATNSTTEFPKVRNVTTTGCEVCLNGTASGNVYWTAIYI